MGLYYANEFKAQQLYYRSLSDKELLEEAGSLHIFEKISKSERGYTPAKWLQRMKNEGHFYNLIARSLDITTKDGKPRADTEGI